MSLKDKASYIFKPSRYTALVAYGFRGGDLTSNRGSSATRVNSQGHIEFLTGSHTPRLNYDPNDLTKEPWILYEDSSTNYATNNTNFANWSISGGSITTGAAISPENTSNADLYTEDTSTNYHRFVNSCTGAGGTTKVYSVYAKAAKGRWLTIDNGPICYFDLVSGVVGIVGSNCTAYMEKFGNDGWYRCVYIHTNSSVGTFYIGSTNVNGGAGNHTGSGLPQFYVYGAQCETGVSVPTSLIKTYVAGAVTRSSDTLYLNGISNVIGSGQGVVYCDFYGQPGATGNYESMFSVNNGNSSYAVNVYKHPSGTFYYEVYTGGSYVALQTYNSSTTTNYRTKMAIYYANNDFGLYINGVRVHTDTSGTAPTGMSSINFNGPAGGYPGTKDLYEFLLFKERLSDEELVALTSFDDYEEVVDIKDLTWESSTITNNRLSELAAL